jgi:hypothetical protein
MGKGCAQFWWGAGLGEANELALFDIGKKKKEYKRNVPINKSLLT